MSPWSEFSKIVYHGSPHQFDRFSLDRIGTGEGAQVFGWGLYFTDTPAVADIYQEQLSRGKWWGKEVISVDGLIVLPGHPDYRAADIASWALQWGETCKDRIYEEIYLRGYDLEKDIQQRVDELMKADITSFRSYGGVVYQVAIPDHTELLDWVKPLEEQPESVRKALAVEIEIALEEGLKTGGDLYNRIAANEGGQKAASLYLNDLGIPGLRYLDGQSRSSGMGSHNYVIWEESAIQVVGNSVLDLNTLDVDSAMDQALSSMEAQSQVAGVAR